MNNLTKYETAALSLFTDEDIEKLKKFDELEAQVKAIKKRRDEELKYLFKESNQNSFEDDRIRIVYTKPHTRKTVDTKKMKEEGIYDYYLTESNVSDSIKIEVKYD